MKAIVGFAIAGAGICLALERDALDPAVIENSISELGAWAPLVYVTLFAVGSVLFVPGVIFGLAGGALFGPLYGAILNLAGAGLGATAAFLAARYLAAGRVRRKAGGRIERVITGVEAEGWRFVAFVRLVPVFPFNLVNYALGLTRIPLTHYVLATLCCMAPGTLAYTWMGHAGREALAGNAVAVRYGLIALALLAAVVFLPRLVQRLRAAGPPLWIGVGDLANRLTERSEVAVIDVREPEEFTGPLGHIASALNLPVGKLGDRLIEINDRKAEPIVLVCRTDKRSANAATLLRNAGFRHVRVLRGGMESWNQQGLPVESRTALEQT
jgi:uncharacterized membrane protein YdjX (TVP38/TMEM64 family)/rhodanese-related sulfurtransferase